MTDRRAASVAVVRRPAGMAPAGPARRTTAARRIAPAPVAARLAALSAGLLPGPALAHGAERGYVLLLPTGHVILAGTLAVAATVLMVRLVPPAAARRSAGAGLALGRPPRISPVPTSTAAAVLLAALIAAGFLGTGDPARNPLPLVVWTVWWIGFTLLQALVGNLWPWLNPVTGPSRLVGRALGARLAAARLPWPERLSAWPAVSGFLAFAWFELVHPAPSDPARLATVTSLYLALGLVFSLTFGEEAWMRRGDPFAVFFRFVGLLSPLIRPDPDSAGRAAGRTSSTGEWSHDARGTRIRGADADVGVAALQPEDRREDRGSGPAAGPQLPSASAAPRHGPLRPARIRVGWPGAALVTAPAPPAAAMMLLLVALASVTFDGLSRTFAWLGAIGANPLEYPGRTALMAENTAGLVGAVLLLSGLFLAAVATGWRLAGRPGPFGVAAGRLALSLLPISVAFHAAHYLPALLVDGQYVALALNDPFGRGADLFGIAGHHVTGSILASPSGAARIYAVQAGLVVAGHAAAVWTAHAIAADLAGDPQAVPPRSPRPAALEAPLAILMIAYTALGLWLLSSPSIG